MQHAIVTQEQEYLKAPIFIAFTSFLHLQLYPFLFFLLQVFFFSVKFKKGCLSFVFVPMRFNFLDFWGVGFLVLFLFGTEVSRGGEVHGKDYISWDDMKVGSFEQRQVLRDEYNGSRVIVVDKNGGGDSTTVQGAVDIVPVHNSQRVKIYILPGVYREKVHVPASKPYISFIGDENRTSETVITWNDKASDKDKYGFPLGTYNSATVTIDSNYFCATGITFENTVVASAGEVGKQAVALRVASFKAMFYKVRILGTQDTLLDQIGSHYYYQSYIQGSIDFIFGNAKSLFQDCVLHSVANRSGAIAAHHRESLSQDTAFSFVNCTITGTGKIFLGRAWGNFSRIIYSYCHIDDIITPSGWSDWEDPWKQKTAVFGEYECRGKGADRRYRVPWSRSFYYTEAKHFLDMKFIGGDQWLRL